MISSDSVGMVSQIQGFCVNDGEGIRTNIFLSGCPLRCRWCANPETWTPEPKLTVVKEKCTGCGKCMEVCPQKAALNPIDSNVFVTEDCDACGKCADACPASARKVLGSFMSVREVVDRVKKDVIYFRQSGGGVTFSGGEPTFQRNFLKEIVDELYELGIDMAIESSGMFRWDDAKDIFDKLDFIFVDLKVFDCEEHRRHTGAGNEVILKNIKEIGKLGKPVVVRIPLMKGVNDDDENISKIAEFVRENVPGGRIEVLPYHSYGAYKYDALGMKELKTVFETPSEDRVKKVEELIRKNGVEVADYK
jgi:pyruvate formate lyase activating enzyme